MKTSLDDENKKKECSCYTCSSACKHRPGWFKSGEVEKVAEYLGISLEELFKTKLAVDWWGGTKKTVPNTVFMLAPGVNTGETGQEYPADPQGTCVFYDEKHNKCTIHPVKPYECREYMHTDSNADSQKYHEEAALTWNNKEAQAQVKKLLGREPVETEPTFSDMISMIHSKWAA